MKSTRFEDFVRNGTPYCDLHVVGQNIANSFVVHFTLWFLHRTLDNYKG